MASVPLHSLLKHGKAWIRANSLKHLLIIWLSACMHAHPHLFLDIYCELDFSPFLLLNKTRCTFQTCECVCWSRWKGWTSRADKCVFVSLCTLSSWPSTSSHSVYRYLLIRFSTRTLIKTQHANVCVYVYSRELRSFWAKTRSPMLLIWDLHLVCKSNTICP